MWFEESPLIAKAYSIAHHCHRGQFRRDGVTPYIEHPSAVAKILRALNKDNEIVAVGILHDVLEDCGSVVWDFGEGVNEAKAQRVIRAVKVLTKAPGESYDKYMERVKNNPVARVVKLVDMFHNLMDNPTEVQKAKYLAGIEELI